MAAVITPDWNDADLAICTKYDQLVKEGKMGYQRIKQRATLKGSVKSSTVLKTVNFRRVGLEW